MEYRVLGSLEVLDGAGQRVPLGGARQQTVLGSLLLRVGETVSLERLVDELWEKPPETAAKTVQVYVSRLRRILSPRAIESRSGGYAPFARRRPARSDAVRAALGRGPRSAECD